MIISRKRYLEELERARFEIIERQDRTDREQHMVREIDRTREELGRVIDEMRRDIRELQKRVADLDGKGNAEG